MELNLGYAAALAIGLIFGIALTLGYVVIHSMRLADDKAKIEEEMAAVLEEMFKEEKKPKRKKVATKEGTVEAIKLTKPRKTSESK